MQLCALVFAIDMLYARWHDFFAQWPSVLQVRHLLLQNSKSTNDWLSNMLWLELTVRWTCTSPCVRRTIAQQICNCSPYHSVDWMDVVANSEYLRCAENAKVSLLRTFLIINDALNISVSIMQIVSMWVRKTWDCIKAVVLELSVYSE